MKRTTYPGTDTEGLLRRQLSTTSASSDPERPVCFLLALSPQRPVFALLCLLSDLNNLHMHAQTGVSPCPEALPQRTGIRVAQICDPTASPSRQSCARGAWDCEWIKPFALASHDVARPEVRLNLVSSKLVKCPDAGQNAAERHQTPSRRLWLLSGFKTAVA